MLWKHYRFDFFHSGSTAGSTGILGSSGDRSTSASLAIPPLHIFEWEHGTSTWKQKGVAPFGQYTVDVSDAIFPLSLQIDTSSTDNSINNYTLGADNVSTNTDINLITCPVPLSSTANLGGRFDTSSGQYTAITSHKDATRKTSAITSAPPNFRLTADNNGSSALNATVILTFCARQVG